MLLLGKRIEQFAQKRGFKPADLAAAIDVSLNYVYKLYKSEHLNTELLQKLSSALDIPMASFFQDDGASAATISQTGFANVSGTGNRQKIMPGTESTGHTNLSTNTNDLASKLADCEKDKLSLARELDITRELVRAKDEMITLLRSSRDNSN
ncbi:helix-turn-helix domain-containing protein [Hymenobacter volaticus]|uniref:Helix-turn-helix transcriptional regulator n=1 Tax=Hymenobacter volaticus TaxID=2932254 RepID=A0ABY4G0M8_9BACT|nr:helix-turn-helix transcriptional regulator [Hymenobacter volaticus]UOQ64422.1 helix-turn-helix transcriptional regulator [Hymenobacter volaticus]